MELFRRQVIENRARRVFGSVTLPVDRRMHRASAALVLTAALGAAALLGYPYAARLHAPGFIDGVGQVTVVAPRPGVVRHVLVHDNQRVARDEVLFVLDHRRTVAGNETDETLRARGFEELLGQVAGARQRAVSAHAREVGWLRERLRHLEAEARAGGAEVAVAQDRSALQHLELERVAVLRARGLVSATAYGERRDAVLRIRQELLQLQRLRGAARLMLEEARTRLVAANAALEDRLADLDAEASRYRQGLAELRADAESRVLAPRAGRITFVDARPGESVPAARALANLVPDDERSRLVVLVPAREAAELRVGMRVTFTYPGEGHGDGPGEGEVLRVSLAPRMPDELAPWLNTGEPVYRAEALVHRFPGNRPGPVGALVAAHLMRDSAPLGHLLHERLRRLTNRS